jgi:hypothetical protein
MMIWDYLVQSFYFWISESFALTSSLSSQFGHYYREETQSVILFVSQMYLVNFLMVRDNVGYQLIAIELTK